MSDVDTSAETVERLASYLDFDAPHQNHIEATAAATLRALLAERDELRSEIERLRQALKFYACDCAKLGDECGERFDDVLCGNTAREALKEKENDQ